MQTDNIVNIDMLQYQYIYIYILTQNITTASHDHVIKVLAVNQNHAYVQFNIYNCQLRRCSCTKRSTVSQPSNISHFNCQWYTFLLPFTETSGKCQACVHFSVILAFIA